MRKEIIAVIGIMTCIALPTVFADPALDMAAYRIRQVKYGTSSVDIGRTSDLDTLASVLKTMIVYNAEPGSETHSDDEVYENGPINRAFTAGNFDSLPDSPTADEIVNAASRLTSIVLIDETGASISNDSIWYVNSAITGIQINIDFFDCDEAWDKVLEGFNSEAYDAAYVPWVPSAPLQKMEASICGPICSLADCIGWSAYIGGYRTYVNLRMPTNDVYSPSHSRIKSYIVGTFGAAPPGGLIAYDTGYASEPQKPTCPETSGCFFNSYYVYASLELYAEIEIPPGDGNCGNNTFTHCSGGACGAGIPRVGVNRQSLSVVVVDRPIWIESAAGPKLEMAMTLDAQSAESKTNGLFGLGWRCSYDSEITGYGTGGAKRVVLPEGGVLQFFSDGLTNGTYAYSGPPILDYQLIGNTDGTFKLNHRLGGSIGYLATNAAGVAKLTYIDDQYGNRLRLLYSTNGLATNILDAASNSLSLFYDASNRVVNVTNATGLGSSFSYSNGLLRGVTDMGGHSYTYEYETNGVAIISNIVTEAGATIISRIGGHAVRLTDPAGHVQEYGFSRTNLDARYEINGRGYTNWIFYTNTLGGWETVREIDALGNERTFGYDSLGRAMAITDASASVTSYTYDDFNNILTESGPLGYSNTYSYATNGIDRLSSLDSLGNSTKYGYNATHDIVAITNPLNEVATFTYSNGLKTVENDFSGLVSYFRYNNSRQLTQTVNSVGATNAYSYDSRGRLAVHVQPSGFAISNSYDGLNRLLSRSYPDATKEGFVYSCCGLTSESNRLGYVTTHQYDAVGRRISTTDPLTNNVSYVLDANGNIEVVSNSLGLAETRVYDALDRVLSVQDCSGAAISNSYDSLGRLIRTSDANSIVTSNSYDQAGRLLASWRGGFLVVSNGYNALGWVISQTDANSMTTTNTYDALGRLRKIYMPDGSYSENVWSNTYLLRSIDRAGRTTTYQRDVLGRITNQIDNATNAVRYIYDSSGNLTDLYDQNTNRTQFRYNSENQLTNKIYADGNTNVYSYNSGGQLISKINGIGATTTYRYDPVGNLTNIDYATDADVYFAYDTLYRQVKMVDGVGTTIYAYASACSAVQAVDGPFADDTVSYGYDTGKRLVSVTSATSVVQYYMDSLDRIGSVVGRATTNAPVTNTYTYIANGRLPDTLTHGSGVLTGYGYDSLFRLTNISHYAGSTNLASYAYAYNAANLRTSVVISASSISPRSISYGYDPIGELKLAQGDFPGYSFAYSYDAAGNPTKQNNNGFVSSNVFNNLNQNSTSVWSGVASVLGTANITNGSVSVNGVAATLRASYDGSVVFAATNIAVTNGTNFLTAIHTDPLGRAATSQVSVVARNRGYGYDKNGNITNDGQLVYVWDNADRLKEVRTQAGSLMMSCKYDGMGRRRERIVAAGYDGGPSTNRYIYNNWLVLEVRDGGTNTLETYTHGPDLSGSLGGAGGIGGILSVFTLNPASGVHYFHYDGNANVVRVSGVSGATDSLLEYGPYGTILIHSGSYDPRYKFSAKEWDAAAGLSYYGMRFYDPETGRFINRDPLGSRDESVLLARIEGFQLNAREKSRNKSHDLAYLFVCNEPVNSVDAYGLFKWRDLIPPGVGWGDLLPGISGPCISLMGSLDVITTKIKGGGTTYNLQHCITSCKISKVCGSGVLNHAAGLFKELFDQYKPKPPFNKDDVWDSSDIQANKDGQGCASSDKGCDCCCKAHGYKN